MKKFFKYISFIRKIPSRFRRQIILHDVEIQLYRAWCWLTGKEFKLPLIKVKFGTCYLVTRYIPEIPFILEGVDLELVKLDCPGHPQKDKRFYRTRFGEGHCEDCGRSMELTERDRLVV